MVQTNGTLWTRFAVLAAIPLLLLYNGQRGHKSKWFQWGYYLIYPIHFIVLYIIELLARGGAPAIQNKTRQSSALPGITV